MLKDRLTAIGGGLVSGLLYFAFVSGSPGYPIIAFLTPLTLMLAGLGLGMNAATIAAAAGLLLALAFTIGATQRSLGTGVFLAQVAEAALNPGFVPAIIFVLACFIAFSTGTSWGTFAIMIPIVIPLYQQLDLHPGLTLAAALGGGIFGGGRRGRSG